MKKGTYLMRKVAGVTAVAMLLSIGIPADVRAAEAVTVDDTFAVSSSVATPGDADGAYLSEDGYFYYYQNGSILKKSGWIMLESGEAVKLDSSYRIVYRQELDGSKKIISKYNASSKEFEVYENDVIELSDGKLYFAGAKGIISTANKTMSDGKGNIYICTSGGVVTGKLVKKESAIYFYTYSVSEHKWIQVKNSYKTVDNKKYYFGSGDGKATKMYDISAGKLYKYINSKMTMIKSDISTVDSNRIYLFNSNGTKLSKSGWYTLKTGSLVLVGKNGYVTAKIAKKGDLRKYYTYDYSSNAWKLKKNQWIAAGNSQYYFSSNGAAKYIYNTKTLKLSQYSNGKFIAAKKEAVKLSNGRIYYFEGSAAKRTCRSGWYTLKSGSMVLVGKNGYVTAKIAKKGNLRKYYTYDYSSNAWKLKKNQWITAGNFQYYFSSNGAAKYIYNTKTSKLSQYANGKFVAAKKEAVKLSNGRIYYFGNNAAKVIKSGWYDISGAGKVFVGSKGWVTMKFSVKPGKLYKYNKNKWELVKVTSYTIGKKVYYFDSNGVVAKNKIVGNNKDGYFYVDSTGCKVTSKEIQMAVDFVMKHKKNGMTANDILHSCYLEMATYGYQRDYVVPDVSRFPELSCDTLRNRYGNCYRFASTLACIATVLGYKARVTCGLVPAVYGVGQTIHGWTEIWNDKAKAWKVYDVNMQRVWTEQEISFYNQFIYDYYPGRHSVDFRVGLTVKNGIAIWSRL